MRSLQRECPHPHSSQTLLLSPYNQHLSPIPPPIVHVFFDFKLKYPCVCVCSVAQSCLTLCDPMDCSSPGSSVHGILHASNTGVGCHVLLQRNLPDPGTEPTSTVSCMAGGFFTTETLGKTKTPIGNPIPTSYKEQSISKGFKCCHSVITTALSKNPVGRGLQYERLLTTPFAVTCKSPGNRNFPPPETPPGHHATVPEDSLPDYQEEAGFTHCQVHPRL